MTTEMTFDPALIGWDRPGGVYGAGLRLYRKDSCGDFLWCRQPTNSERLWIFEHGPETKGAVWLDPDGTHSRAAERDALRLAQNQRQAAQAQLSVSTAAWHEAERLYECLQQSRDLDIPLLAQALQDFLAKKGIS